MLLSYRLEKLQAFENYSYRIESKKNPANYGRNTQEPYDKHYYGRDVLCPRKTTVFLSKNKDYRGLSPIVTATKTESEM